MLRRVLLAGIRFYRRHLSGRGPFRRVRCTFVGLESCSAFAERIVVQTPSAWTAMRRIVRRLGRCHRLSLYRLEDGKLGWGSDYDVVLTSAFAKEAARQIENALAADGEGPHVRAAVREATALVATAAGSPAVPVTDNVPLPLIRSGMAAQQAFSRRYRRRMLTALLAAALGLAAFVLDQGTVPVALCLLVAGLELVLAGRARGVLRRIEWLEVLAAIEGPMRTG